MRAWGRIFTRHYSDEVLLAHADAELPRLRRYFVNRHLEVCWRCRAHRAELNETAQRLATAAERGLFPGPARLAEARSSLLDGMDKYERSRQAVPQFLVGRGRSSRLAWVTAGALFCVIGWAVWHFLAPLSPTPWQALAKAVAAEDVLTVAPLLQQFRIEVREAGKAPRAVGRLSVWSDGRTGCFASRWIDGGGHLKHAVWRPSRDRLFVYDAAAGAEARQVPSGSVKMISVADLADRGLSPQELERVVMNWLESHSWRPMSLSRNMARFAGLNGTRLVVEQVSSPSGDKLLRLTARRELDGWTVIAVIDLDAATSQPRVERLRIRDTAGRKLEIRLVPTGNSNLPGAASDIFSHGWVQRTVFGEHIRIVSPDRRITAARPSPVAEPAVVRPTLAQLLATEIEARYVLHREGFCLDNPVEIRRHPGSYIEIRAVAERPERKARLLAALNNVNGRQFLRISISSAGDEPMVGSEPVEHIVVQSAVEAGDRRKTSAGRSGMERELFRLFELRGMTPVAAEARVMALSNRAVSLTESMLAEEWAIRRLAQSYGGAEIELLMPQSQWLLEVMLHDHQRELRADVRELRKELDPLLPALTGDMPVPAARPAGVLPWNSGGLEVFERTRALSELVLRVFAGSGTEAELEPARAAARLLADLAAVDTGAGGFGGSLARGFSGDPRRRFANNTEENGAARQ